MADVLVELGRVDTWSMGQEQVEISLIEDFVDSWENPAVGIIGPDEEIDPAEERILARIRALSALQRAALVKKGPLSGLSDADCERIWKCFPSLKPFSNRSFESFKGYNPEGSFTGHDARYPLPPERANYPGILHGYVSLLARIELGKKKRKKGGISGLFKKIAKTATSPTGLSVLAAASSFIPAGTATSAISGVAIAGLTRYTAAKYGIDQTALAQQIAAMSSVGAAISGNTSTAMMVSKALGIKYDPKTARDPLALTAMILKGSGQLIALNRLAKGAGKVGGLFGADADALLARMQSTMSKAALDAGMNDVLASGAAAGVGSAVELGLSRGEGGFPIVEVAIGAGALVVVVGVVMLAKR